jgi:hypothetical protein
MASFVDNPNIQFNPYIDVIASDALVRVEMAKQEQFNQGWEKIQGQFGYVMGLPQAKEETKQYIQGKLSQLKNNIASYTTGDFGDMRLINQISGLTGRIVNDPIVQNGVQSTARAQKAFQQMDEDRKAGKLTPDNEYDFMKNYSAWLGDGRPDTAFEGSYTTHVDPIKRFLELYKEVKPDSALTQNDVRINDGTGQIEVLNERNYEGIDAATVQSVWGQVTADPAIQNQLRISAQYKYRTLDGDGFSRHLKESYEGNLKSIQQKVEEIQRQVGVDKTLDPRIASQQINSLKNAGTQLVDQYNQIGSLLEQGDIDGAKTALYNTNLSSSVVSNYSWSKTTDKIVDSPLWKAHMDQVKYELDVLEFNYKKVHDREVLQAELLKAANKKGPNDTETRTYPTPVDEHQGEKTEASFRQRTDELNEQGWQSTYQWVFESLPRDKNNPVKYDPQTGKYIWNIDPKGIDSKYTSVDQAIKATGDRYKELRKLMDEGKLSDRQKSFYTNTIHPLSQVITQRKDFIKKKEEEYKAVSDEQLQSMGIKDFALQYSDGTKMTKLTLTSADMLKLYQYLEGGPGKETAEAQLRSKFGDKDFTYITSSATTKGARGIDAQGTLYEPYQKMKKAFSSNKNLHSTILQKEADYKSAQMTFEPSQTDIIPKDETDNKYWNGQFSSIARQYASLNGASEYKEFLDFLDSKPKNSRDVMTYSVVHDQDTDKWYLKAGLGEDQKEIEIDQRYVSGLGFKTYNEFWQKFGPALSLKNNTSTDLNGTRESSSYPMERPNSKYQVRYHLEGDGRGTYNFRIWVRDSQGNVLLDGTDPGIYGDRNVVMEAITNPQYLKSDLFIDGLLKK